MKNQVYKNVKLNILSKNKYIKGYLIKYLKGNKENTLINNVREDEDFLKLSYNISFDPFAKYNRRLDQIFPIIR